MLFKALPCCLCSPNTSGRMLEHDSLKQRQAGSLLVFYCKKCKIAIHSKTSPLPLFQWLKSCLVLWCRILSRDFSTELSWFALERARGHDEILDFYAVTLRWSIRSGLNLRQCRSSNFRHLGYFNGKWQVPARRQIGNFLISCWPWMDLNHEAALGIKFSAGSTGKP